MRTIRGRLVVSYAIALVATVTVFAATIYLVQRGENFAELDARARLEADFIGELLRESARRLEPIVVTDADTKKPVLADRISAVLHVLRDYVIVLGPKGEVLFLSDDAAALPYGSLVRLTQLAVEPSAEGKVGAADLGPPAREVRYVVRSIAGAGPEVLRAVSGAPTAGLVLGPQRLLTAMLLTAPLIIGLSVLIGHFLVGRTLQPVEAIVEEVEAISDGRSLHRRLMEPTSRDELGRLTDTLNAMLARLERSFASLRRFTADASHELKTPLTVLRSGIERAITHPKAPPEVMEVLEETLIEVNRMAELVDALLTLARADEGRAPVHLEPVELEDILSEVSETANFLGEQAKVSVAVSAPPKPCKIAVDRSRIRQLLMNLLSNAIKYTPQGGSVAIDCSQANAQVVLSVRDTGVGIAPGDLPHVFDRFWRADQARSRTGQRPGAGLGLAISKWIVEAHGGTITVQSRPGRGTTFTVTLPTGTPDALAGQGPGG